MKPKVLVVNHEEQLKEVANKDQDSGRLKTKNKRQLDDSTPTSSSSIVHHEKKIKKEEESIYRYILAPMVGASDLPFRFLCRKYGAQICYTPMLSSTKLVNDPDYRSAEFPLQEEQFNVSASLKRMPEEDRDLLRKTDSAMTSCHVSSNDPQEFAAAAVQAQRLGFPAIDLNLGCPQRTAFVGHFGSYLLDDEDRNLVLNMVRKASKAVKKQIKITVKIRLLSTLEKTIEFCKQLCESGADVITIHGRQRASWERTGPGAREGPADLEQIAKVQSIIQKTFPSVLIITNGNTKTWEDVVENLNHTQASGLMSAEGILDNPALFLPRYGKNRDQLLTVWTVVEKPHDDDDDKKISKLKQKIEIIDDALKQQQEEENHELLKLKKEKKMKKLAKLTAPSVEQVTVSLGSLYDSASNKLSLAMEYLNWATVFPVAVRTIIFHTRRILKAELTKYQLLEDCLRCDSLEDVRLILKKIESYQANPTSFAFDKEKAKKEKDALERKKQEEGRRKEFEARMIRKAKREGKSDLHFYLKFGAEVPSLEKIAKFKTMSKEQVLPIWKQDHSQHCMPYHLDQCPRGKTCAFLHVDSKSCSNGSSSTVTTTSTTTTTTAFNEMDEVAG